MSIHTSYFFSKYKLLYIIFNIILTCIIARLTYLQIHLGTYFYTRSTHNFLRTESIPSRRGDIVDKYGNLLATNRPIHSVYWNGTGNNHLTQEQQDMFSSLCTIFSIDRQNEYNSLIHHEHTHKQKLLAVDIPFSALSYIEELWHNHPNIHIKVESKRYYPHASYASHIIGYLGTHNNELRGITGLEKLQHTILKGSEGTLIKTMNSFGRNLVQKELEKSLGGDTVHTTLDLALQNIAEQVFPQEQSGTLIVMDPKTGAINALVSRPTFNPGMFLEHISTQQWKELQQQKPFLNRALQACYPLGSIFKLVTISAALEHNFIEPNSTWNCKGFFYFGKRKYWCNRRWGHGTINTAQSVAQSCNILFFDIGAHIDIDLLADYASRFGLGKKTGCALPEKSGLVPSRSWKKKHKGEQWWQGETLSVAIGQSFLLATPIQATRMISAIFTGYLVQPRFLLSEPIVCTPFSIQQTTRNFLKNSMRSVVTQGTGRRLNTLEDIEIYAKTSTAQVTEFSKRKQRAKNLEHGWFVAHVSYKEHDPFTILVLAEHTGTSRIPTTIAKNFLIKYKKLMERTS